LTIFTIGHSNRSWEDFAALLTEFGIDAVVDVRRYPTSRKFPHFNREAMRRALLEMGIEYHWFESLGGRRHGAANADSPNAGLSSPAFRNYADYMLTENFTHAVDKLLEIANRKRTAVMCAERFYWRCHRRLLCDYLTSRGIEVVHIIDSGNSRPHKLTPNAVLGEGGGVTYPAEREEEK